MKATNIQTVLRNGKILVDNRTEIERYYLISYNSKFYEVELTLGEVQKYSSSKILPKYANVLIESKYNQVSK